MAEPVVAVQVRLPLDLFNRCHKQASKEGTSVNTLLKRWAEAMTDPDPRRRPTVAPF